MAFWRSYRRSAPRAADGIKARHAGKGFASQWWAQRWLGALKSFGWESRLQRGRSYATRGQVLDYQVEAGQVRARVQGSRATPYKVELALPALQAQDWARAVERMTERASFLAMLLAGEMPPDIEEAFAPESLVPTRAGELKTTCSCPDWANPCKHVAAVHYILAEALDQDPFLLFELRGMSREELLSRINRQAPQSEEEEPIAPRPTDPQQFWRPFRLELPLDVSCPPVRLAALRRLGPPGRWLDSEPFLATLEPLYAELGAQARELLACERTSKPEPAAGPKRGRPRGAGKREPDPAPCETKRGRSRGASGRKPGLAERTQGSARREPGAKLPRGRGLLALKIAAHSPLSTAWMRDHWGLEPDVARQELEQLVQAGWLESRGRTRGKHYVLTDRAREALG